MNPCLKPCFQYGLTVRLVLLEHFKDFPYLSSKTPSLNEFFASIPTLSFGVFDALNAIKSLIPKTIDQAMPFASIRHCFVLNIKNMIFLSYTAF